MNNPRAFPNTNATIPPEGDYWNYQGMTLRDYMAAKAMQAFLTRETKFNQDLMMYAGAAYDVADAMLKAREQ